MSMGDEKPNRAILTTATVGRTDPASPASRATISLFSATFAQVLDTHSSPPAPGTDGRVNDYSVPVEI